jgi:hypothetical protein
VLGSHNQRGDKDELHCSNRGWLHLRISCDLVLFKYITCTYFQVLFLGAETADASEMVPVCHPT